MAASRRMAVVSWASAWAKPLALPASGKRNLHCAGLPQAAALWLVGWSCAPARSANPTRGSYSGVQMVSVGQGFKYSCARSPCPPWASEVPLPQSEQHPVPGPPADARVGVGVGGCGCSCSCGRPLSAPRAAATCSRAAASRRLSSLSWIEAPAAASMAAGCLPPSRPGVVVTWVSGEGHHDCRGVWYARSVVLRA